MNYFRVWQTVRSKTKFGQQTQRLRWEKSRLLPSRYLPAQNVDHSRRIYTAVDMTTRLTVFDNQITKIFSVDQSYYKSKTNNNKQQLILLFSSPPCHVVRFSTILVQDVFTSSFASKLNVGHRDDIPAKQVLGKYIGEPYHFRSDVIQATKVKVVRRTSFIHVLFAGSSHYRTLYDRYLAFIMKQCIARCVLFN